MGLIVRLRCPKCGSRLKFVEHQEHECEDESINLPLFECTRCNLRTTHPAKYCPKCGWCLEVVCLWAEDCEDYPDCDGCPEFCPTRILECRLCGTQWEIGDNAFLYEVEEEEEFLVDEI